MAYASSFWLHCGMLCSVLALVSAGDSSWDCSDSEDILREVPADVSAPSDCTLHCTARTYRAVLELHNRLTIRFTDSHPGESEEYCWSTRIKCSPGQRLQGAFIFLPVDLSAVSKETLRLQISSETDAAALQHQHAESSLFPSECGLRFDATQHLAAEERRPNLCVRIVAQEQSGLGSRLMCPPFLVTTWEKMELGMNPSPLS